MRVILIAIKNIKYSLRKLTQPKKDMVAQTFNMRPAHLINMSERLLCEKKNHQISPRTYPRHPSVSSHNKIIILTINQQNIMQDLPIFSFIFLELYMERVITRTSGRSCGSIARWRPIRCLIYMWCYRPVNKKKQIYVI